MPPLYDMKTTYSVSGVTYHVIGWTQGTSVEREIGFSISDGYRLIEFFTTSMPELQTSN